MKIAFVHDWLTGMRGGERVLEALIEGALPFDPRPEIYTLFSEKQNLSPFLQSFPIHTSWLQKARSKYQSLLPLMPWAIESLTIPHDVDLIISSSHCVAKGIRHHAPHISYIHAPMRYMWDRFDEYFPSYPLRAVGQLFRPFLQKWDYGVSQKPNALYANSHFIAEKIMQAYGRTSEVLHPFVDLHRFEGPRTPSSSYLMVGAAVPYKRVDLAINACTALNIQLEIIGKNYEPWIRHAGPTIQFLGQLSDEAVSHKMRTCRALLFPGKEDFGITPLESLASGTPVIAFSAGGACETITENTGVFFSTQSTQSLMDAISRMEVTTFDPNVCRKQAARFSRDIFLKKWQHILASWVKKTLA